MCVIHENINLLLKVLSKEVQGLKNNLSEFLLKLVCSESDENCMMSQCDNCINSFDQSIIKKIIDKGKIIDWYQWTNKNGRSTKEKFSGKSES